jgi:hopanoid biosynthesis associated RND transporter like protein HpnN
VRSLLLARLAAACVRRAGWVALLAVVLAAGSAWLAATRLGVSTDTGSLFSASLPWRQDAVIMSQAFPQNEDLLVAVVDSATPEESEATAAALADALKLDTQHFKEVRRPDASPYLERNGLLFLDAGPLGTLLDQTVDAQPFLGQLAADPSLRGLLSALGLIAEGIKAGQANLTPFEPSLKGFHAALSEAAAGRAKPMSWERLLAGSMADMGGAYHFVLTQPRLDYGALQPGAAATQAIRAAAAKLEFVRAGSAHVRLTGSVALEDEEFATIANGAVTGLLGSALLVGVLLWLAVRTWRLIAPVLLTLVLGLLLTTGFAALAVGTLNLVSVAFAVLFVGIAVDFGIQLSVRFRDERLRTSGTPAALVATVRYAGPQVTVAAVASAAGFLAFTPTSFVGVAQLGLIAGGGMLIAFACTMTVLPALITLFQPPDGVTEAGLAWLARLDQPIVRQHRLVLGVFVVFGVAGLLWLPLLAFDSDPLNTKDQTTEAVRTLHDLIEDPVANPYTIDILAPSAADAGAMAERLGRLSLVDSVITANSFVPADQAAKLPLVADAATLLGPTLAARPAGPRPAAPELRRAAQEASAALLAVRDQIPPGSTLAAISGDLQALTAASDPVLLAADAALTRFLPLQLDRLGTVLQAAPTTLADVPADILRDWVLPDGRAKLQVVPKRAAMSSTGLHDFVAQVRTVAPNAGGAAITITESADTVVGAFRTAAALALAAIAVILVVALRRIVDVVLVIVPLVLSSLLTVLAAVLLPLPLNFANIIALPLLLGVGVSFNIYFVMNWRAGRESPLGSATARAVLFSALTTATAFGSLALSHHPGTASMGRLLLLSLGCTLLTTLLFVPALLAALGPPRKR